MYLCYLCPVIKSIQHDYGRDYIASVANQDLEVLVLFCCFHCARISPLLLTGFKCLFV